PRVPHSPLFPYTTLFRSVDVLERDDRHHRPENLIPGDLHVVRHPRKHRRLNEISTFAEPLAAAEHIGAARPARLDVEHDLVELLDRKSTRLNSSHVKISY